MAYEQIIIEMGAPPALAFAVEELMRDQYGTLDHLDRTTFRREVKLALRVIAELQRPVYKTDETVMLHGSCRARIVGPEERYPGWWIVREPEAAADRPGYFKSCGKNKNGCIVHESAITRFAADAARKFTRHFIPPVLCK